MKKNKSQFAVIGLGGFGQTLCRRLYKLGKDVLAIDNNSELVEDIKDSSTQAICADATDEEVLKTLQIQDFDTIIVCIGDTEANIFVTLLAKQLGTPQVISKANNALHKTVLEKIGADYVVFPEEYMGLKVASMITSPSILELAELTPNFSIIEIKTPDKWTGKNLIQLNLRNKIGVTVLLVKRGSDIHITPKGDFVFCNDDEIILCGAKAHIEKLSKNSHVTLNHSFL